MKLAGPLIWGAGIAGAGIASYFVWKNYFAAQMELPAGVAGPQGEQGGAIQLVQNRERARDVRPELSRFLDWWTNNGPFPILVAPDGGVRTDAAKQAQFYAQGYSKAKTLEQTPHGRGAAIDLWPVGFNPAVKLDDQPVIKKRFEEMGRIGKTSFGLTWGGDWGWDYPHFEVKGWRSLPMPGAGVRIAGLNGLSDSPGTGVTASAATSATTSPIPFSHLLGGALIGAAGVLIVQKVIEASESPRDKKVKAAVEKYERYMKTNAKF
jgi:hypothetical protein